MANYSYVSVPTSVRLDFDKITQLIESFIFFRWGAKVKIESNSFMNWAIHTTGQDTYTWRVFVPNTNDFFTYGEAGNGEPLGFSVEFTEGEDRIGFRSPGINEWCHWAQRFLYYSFANFFGVSVYHDALGDETDPDSYSKSDMQPYWVTFREYVYEHSFLKVEEGDTLEPRRLRYIEQAPQGLIDC